MPSAPQEIKFEQRGIGTVLTLDRLVVPLNQREYSWQKEHVTDLLTDFANAIAEDRAYFLGTIVLTTGDQDIPEVSDGQQRLATTTILLASIRDYFFRNDDKKRAASIETDYLGKTDIETTESVPRLRLNVDDNEFFSKFVLPSPDSPDRAIEPSKDSHRRIAEAAALCADQVAAVVQPYRDSDRIARLLEWVKFISNRATVIVLRVPDHMNAFMMFETLNDRGLKASQADLIKNHLLSQAKARLTEAQSQWARMTGVLESMSVATDDITVDFLHHVLITRDGPTKEREVFDKVRQFATSEGRALEFLTDIAESAHDYAALFNSDHTKWNVYGTSTRKHIATINRDLRVEQIRPLMLAIASRFSVKEARIAFRLCLFWSVRFLIVGGRGGLLDRNYALRAQEVGVKRITTAQQLAAAMVDVVPNDAVFEVNFAQARVSQVHLARYCLRALELKNTGNAEPEWIPQDEEDTINLEHILPENPEGNWPTIDPDTARAYWRRIGNMVILQAKKNSIIGNSSYADKKPTLSASAFALTRETAAEIDWGVRQIEERQARLAKLAVETWPSRV
jgi:hypothetical protein